MATATKKIATDETLNLLAKDATLQSANAALGLLGKDASLLLIKGAIEALPNATQTAADNANAAATAANNAVARLNSMISITQIGTSDNYKMTVNEV